MLTLGLWSPWNLSMPACCPSGVNKTMDRRYEDRPGMLRPDVESTQALVSAHGRAPEPAAQARSRPPVPLGEDRLVVRAGPVHGAAGLLDRARLPVRDRPLRAASRRRLPGALRPDPLGDRASRGPLATARGDPHAVRTSRRRDR